MDRRSISLIFMLLTITSGLTSPLLASPSTDRLDQSDSTQAHRPDEVRRSHSDLVMRDGSLIDVRSLGAKLDGTTDDSAAWIEAINQANDLTVHGTHVCVYLPAGNSRVVSKLPPFDGPGCILGDGPHHSYITVDRGYVGDLFSWSEAWMGDSYPSFGTLAVRDDQAGPMVSELTIIGSSTAQKEQNAFMFYDRNDKVLIKDVDVYYINGRGLYTGVLKRMPVSYMRESKFFNLAFWFCGTKSLPAVELSSVGDTKSDSTNELSFYGLDIESPRGVGLVIRNANTGAGIRLIRFFGFRAEGGSNGDLVTIGSDDQKFIGNVNNISFYGFEANGSATGHASLRITASQNSVEIPYDILVDGTIPTGRGTGLNIDAGRNLKFHLLDLHTDNTELTVGNAPLVGENIEIDGNGEERYWTRRIDKISFGKIRLPVTSTGRELER